MSLVVPPFIEIFSFFSVLFYCHFVKIKDQFDFKLYSIIFCDL